MRSNRVGLIETLDKMVMQIGSLGQYGADCLGTESRHFSETATLLLGREVALTDAHQGVELLPRWLRQRDDCIAQGARYRPQVRRFHTRIP
jgi:hypothetical protein